MLPHHSTSPPSGLFVPNVKHYKIIFDYSKKRKKKKVYPSKKEKLKKKFSPGKTKGQRMGCREVVVGGIWEREGRARYVLIINFQLKMSE